MLNEVKSRFLSGKSILATIILTISLITFTNAQGITMTLGGNTAADKFIVENNNSEAGLVVTGEGNVGIGNSTPFVELHVKGSKEIIRMESTTLSSGFLSIFNSSGYQGYLGTYNGADDIDVGTGSSNTTGKLHLVTQATPRMTILANGNVGIGTVNPASRLSVGGDGYSYATIYGEQSADYSYGIYATATGSSGRGVLGYAHGSSGWGVFGNATGDNGYGIYGQATGTNGKGVVGWGNAYDFDAIGGRVNYGATSSIRWKRNIIEIDNPLEKLAELRGVYFDWDEEHGGGHDVGMIAEEVGKVLPEIVVYEDNGIDADGMDYSKLTPLLIEVAKAQQKLIEELQSEIEILKSR